MYQGVTDLPHKFFMLLCIFYFKICSSFSHELGRTDGPWVGVKQSCCIDQVAFHIYLIPLYSAYTVFTA